MAKWGGNSSELPSGQPINLGWLMVEHEGDLRIVLVSDKLFSQVVNSNLEVRTSVAINPETGAAEERALFIYEAIPRATILWMDVVVSDFKGKFPSKGRLGRWLKENGKDFGSDEKPSRVEYYNSKRPHQSLEYRAPDEVYYGRVYK